MYRLIQHKIVKYAQIHCNSEDLSIKKKYNYKNLIVLYPPHNFLWADLCLRGRNLLFEKTGSFIENNILIFANDVHNSAELFVNIEATAD